MASEGLHEPADLLDEATIDHHRAVTSLCEELEAVDWYDQRVKATADATLAAVLAHNRDEEKEHASMTLEWLRRRDPALDRHLRTYLFTSDPITEIEVEADCVDTHHVASISVEPDDGILFKTRNSLIETEAPFAPNFVFISPAAAQMLVDKKIKLVGIDYLSVDKADSPDYPTHYKFLGNDVLILEGTCLKGVAPGRFELYALPLKIQDADER